MTSHKLGWNCFILADIVSQSGDSPQYLAFLWLVYYDDAILCSPLSNDEATISAIDGTAEDLTRMLLDSRSLFVDTSFVFIHDILDRIIQRFALAMLYFSFQGSDWDNCSNDRNVINSSCVDNDGMVLTRFLDSSHECEWFGVTCSTNATEMDASTYHPITHLELSSNNLYGYIPEEISLLYTLKVLDL